MRTICRRGVIALSLLLASLLCLSGCENGGHFTFLGYTTQPPFNCDIRTIYVPIALNTTYRQAIEFDLTKAVINEINFRSPYRIVSDRARADTELTMKIVMHKKTAIIINQLGETRDAEINMQIEVVWKDLRPGHVGDVLSNPKRFDPNELPLPGDGAPVAPPAVPLLLTPTGTYIPELGGSNVTAENQAIRKAAMQIVNLMEVWRRP